MIWLRTLILVALWAVFALLAQWLIGDPAGWIVFSVALSAMLLWRSWRLSLVSKWANQPDSSPPASVGPWDDILAPLYRYTRARARELAETRDTMQGMLAAAQALPDGAVTLNEDFQIDWCNRMARQHLGLRLPADRGHNLLNLLRAPEFVEYAHRPSWPEPILVRLGQQGQERLMMMQLTAYASNQRLLITRDVTQIERLETTRRDFVANVSHELRTPLTVLAGFLETLRDMPDEALPKEQREQYIDMMHEQAHRMQAIVEDLLTLSTLESSPGSDPRAVNMGALLQKARQQIEALSGGRHELVWHIDETLDVLGAENELTSALSNLLTNAVRYTPDGGTITVRWARDPEGGASYSVQDTGIGIPARHLPRLTERFYRVDRGRSRAVGGTGLGLAITKHIAMRHDAELLITSEPGKGSVFSLRFPADRIAIAETA
ncbi:phosphate regulon sensor histidine kinase PhoR [Achromobacter mucicolens]|uniref:phosphate regulon sensor histidine kinase PhoR n=1 Tax=Achromobacter mucicolens TaxID=1389922 RepID=UPI0007C6D9E1|nr:phosphate regulon sensor histidine kinase PhoR [Achromobacter mucicolens]OAE60030.1 phosphate regulon sensor histidine kinase PhoR [Achromobacter xylosoxidans]PTX02552.1 phosphate regulon sensor histidine kinase PhoR [Achromobacter mucicolens]